MNVQKVDNKFLSALYAKYVKYGMGRYINEISGKLDLL